MVTLDSTIVDELKRIAKNGHLMGDFEPFEDATYTTNPHKGKPVATCRTCGASIWLTRGGQSVDLKARLLDARCKGVR